MENCICTSESLYTSKNLMCREYLESATFSILDTFSLKGTSRSCKKIIF